MATISRIGGITNPQLTGQVAESARPQPENPSLRSEREIQGPPSPRGVNDTPAYQEAVSQQNEFPTPDQIRATVEKLQRTMDEYSAEPREVGFRNDPTTDTVVIEIRNREGELIKQFPQEKVLNLHRKLDELSGIVIDRMT